MSVHIDIDSMIEVIPDMVCVLDDKGVIVNCNEVQAQKTGYKKQELVGMLGFDLVEKESQIVARKSFERLTVQNKMTNVEVWGKRKNGKYRALSTICRLPSNEPLFLVVTKDITELHEAKNALFEIKTQKFSKIGELTSKLVHDIKNPLSVAKMNLTVLKLNLRKDSHENLQKITAIEEMLSDIDRLVSDMGDFVRSQKIQKEFHKASSLLKSAVNSTVIPNRIDIKLPENDATVFCDFQNMVLVLRNMISNSVEAISGSGSIWFEINECVDSIKISVLDSGDGISETNLKNIFDVMFTTKKTGTGLGLSICKNIAEQHNGIINVELNPTKFTIILPCVSNDMIHE